MISHRLPAWSQGQEQMTHGERIPGRQSQGGFLVYTQPQTACATCRKTHHLPLLVALPLAVHSADTAKARAGLWSRISPGSVCLVRSRHGSSRTALCPKDPSLGALDTHGKATPPHAASGRASSGIQSWGRLDVLSLSWYFSKRGRSSPTCPGVLAGGQQSPE